MKYLLAILSLLLLGTGLTTRYGVSAVVSSNTSASENIPSTVLVSGTVVSLRKPVTSAAVFLCLPENLTPERPEAERVATSSADGRFSFSYTVSVNTHKQSSAVVFALKKGYALGMTRLTEEPSKVDLTIDCGNPEPLTGFVFDENNAGIAGATVTPLITAGTKGTYYDDYVYAEIPGLETISNPDGSFELACLPPGISVHLALHAKGYARKVVGPVRTGQRGFPFTLVREGRITGRVVDAVTGKPASNVIVRALSEPNIYFSDPFSAVTGTDGRFLMTGVGPGLYTIHVAEIPGTLPGRVVRFVKNIEVRSEETTDVPEIKLIEGVILTGRLSFRETDEPISRVRVDAYIKGEKPRNVYTDDTGKYTIPGMPGSGFVRPSPMNIYDDAGMEPHSREFEIAEGDTINGLDFTFDKGIPMTVRVLSPEGTPVPYARLYGFPVVGESGEVTVYCGAKRERFGFTATRDDLHLRGENHTTDIRPETVLEIRMQRYETTSASGRVIDSNGESIPLATISAKSKRKNIRNATWNILVGVLTDGNGRFPADGLVIGDENSIVVSKSGYKNVEVTLDTLEISLNDLGDIVLEPALCWLEGIVMNKRDEPVPGVEISIWNDIGQNSARTMTDSNGTYRMEGLLPMMKWIQVEKENYRDYYTRNVVTNRSQNIVLLGNDRWIEGKIIDVNGSPIVNAEIYRSWPYWIKDTTTDVSGRYKLDGLYGVTEDIKIVHQEYGELFYYFIPTNGSREFVLKKPDRFLSGTVVSPDKKPVAGVSIRNLSYDYPEGPEFERWWYPFGEKGWKTDEKGRFRIDGIIEGAFRMVLYHEDFGEVEIGNIETNRDDAVIVMKDDPEFRSRGKFREFDSGNAPPADGSFGPELDASRWINGGPLTLAGLRGKIVILDFWSKDDFLSWNATRLMQALHTEYSGRGVAVIGVHEYTDDIEAVRAVMDKNGITYPVLIDTPPSREKSGGATFDAYGISRLDEDFLIGRDGKIRFHISVHQMEQELLNLLAK